MHYDSFKFNDNTFMGESENAYDLVYGCIGQGQASVTTIGLNMYTNAILNKGVLAEPHFILGSNDKREEPMKAKTQAVTRQMCTEEVADSIKNMMVKSWEKEQDVTLQLMELRWHLKPVPVKKETERHRRYS